MGSSVRVSVVYVLSVERVPALLCEKLHQYAITSAKSTTTIANFVFLMLEWRPGRRRPLGRRQLPEGRAER